MMIRAGDWTGVERAMVIAEIWLHRKTFGLQLVVTQRASFKTQKKSMGCGMPAVFQPGLGEFIAPWGTHPERNKKWLG